MGPAIRLCWAQSPEQHAQNVIAASAALRHTRSGQFLVLLKSKVGIPAQHQGEGCRHFLLLREAKN